MPFEPQLIVLQATLTANGTGTLTYTVDPSEEFRVTGWIWDSTGTFEITDIRSSNGISYTNALSNKTIPSSVLAQANTNNNLIGAFPVPLILKDNNVLNIDITDTSGAGNTVKVILIAEREYRGSR